MPGKIFTISLTLSPRGASITPLAEKIIVPIRLQEHQINIYLPQQNIMGLVTTSRVTTTTFTTTTKNTITTTNKINSL